MKFKKVLILLLSLASTNVLATKIWLPATIKIKFPSLDVTQDIPLPVSGKPGPAVGDKFGAGFLPVIGGEVSLVKRIYAEDPINEKREDISSIQTLNAGSVFLNAQSPKGYRVHYTNRKALTIAGGVKGGPGGFLFLNASLKVGTNLSTTFLYNKHVKTITEAKNVGTIINPAIPLDLESIDKVLSTGDSISYIKSGDLFLNFAAGAGWIASVGVGGNIQSEWNVTIGRLGDSVVKVTYKKGKSSKINFNISNLISGFDISALKEKARQISFTFDLKNKTVVPNNLLKLIITKKSNRLKQLLQKNRLEKFAKLTSHKKLKENDNNYEIDLEGFTPEMAYQLAIKGDLSIAELLSNDNRFGIKKVDITDQSGRKKSLSGSFTVPWLFSANFTKSDSQTFVDLKKISDNLNVITYNGLVSRNWSTSGPLSNDFNRTKVFSGFAQVIRDLTYPYLEDDLRYAGNLSFAAEKNNSTPSQIINEIRNVKNIFGYKKVFDPLIAKFKDIKQRSPSIKVRSFNLKADLILSSSAIDTIAEIANQWGKEVITEAHYYIDAFADKYKSIDSKTGEEFDYKNLKNKMTKTSVAKKELCRDTLNLKLDLCIKELKRKVANQIKKALSAAKDIDGFIVSAKEQNEIIPEIKKEIGLNNKAFSLYYNDQTDKNETQNKNSDHSKDKLAIFTKHLADLGDSISYNRFTLKTFLRLLRYKCPPYIYNKFLKGGDTQEEASLKCPERRIKVTILGREKELRVPYLIKFTLQSSEIPQVSEILYGSEFKDIIE